MAWGMAALCGTLVVTTLVALRAGSGRAEQPGAAAVPATRGPKE